MEPDHWKAVSKSGRLDLMTLLNGIPEDAWTAEMVAAMNRLLILTEVIGGLDET